MTSFDQLVDLYIEHLKLQSSPTPDGQNNTVVNYSVDLAQFGGYLEAQKISDIADIEPRNIKTYLRDMSGWYAKASVSRKLSALRGVFSFACSSGLIARDPMRGVIGPKAPKPLPKAVSVQTMLDLINAAANGKNPQRDTLIIEVMYSAGLRISEFVGLRWQDVDLEGRWLTVVGKGDKERRVPFGRYAAKAFEDWREYTGKGDGYVLINEKGERYTVRTVHRIITAAARQIGAFSITPHVLRHTCATHLLEGGASLKFIQEFLGHENLSTTQVYLTISAARMKESYCKAHPRAIEGDDIQ